MDYRELIRLANEPGPMQGMAMQALEEAYMATMAQEYVDSLPAGPPVGDYDDYESKIIRNTMEDPPADLPWYQDVYRFMKGVPGYASAASDMAGDYLTSEEGVWEVGDEMLKAFAPVASQLDSYNWAQDNLRKYHELKTRDPLSALGYLPLAGAGYIGSIPGLSAVVAGGRKLGEGTKLLYEGLF